jgi:hypothetical protein
LRLRKQFGVVLDEVAEWMQNETRENRFVDKGTDFTINP